MKLRVVAAAAMGLASIAVMAGPAQADGREASVADTSAQVSAAAGEDLCLRVFDYAGDEAGEACFESYGDKFLVSDYSSDGLRVIADWETDYGRSGECHQVGGVGASGYCNYDMKEDGQVRFRVLRRDGAEGDDHNRTPWSRWLQIG